MTIRVGTCGWQYDDWREAFYPREVPQNAWLAEYAKTFDTVECDNAFYRLPSRETFERWAAVLPDGFTMAVKASRFLTHIKRLKDPQEPVQRLLDHCGGLGARLGPILLQLPPSMKADLGRLEATLGSFAPHVRVAVEPRHESWWTADLRRLLESRNAPLVWADRLGKPVAPLWRTADWAYVRLHEGRAHPWPSYGETALRTWLHRITETWTSSEDVFVYFNNDPGAAAIRNARTLLRMLDRAHAR
ncbi:MAG: hypothetical protein QOJ62_935 [Actinomycetota bacterium]|nr:hypothetical protein [Actinomycetota bacterium]